jgi:hypothetical protein
MTAQRSVITQVPLMFAFPWDIFVIVLVVSLVCSFLATVSPIYQIVSRGSIVSLIRG